MNEEELVELYKPIVSKVLNRFIRNDLNKDELYQEGLISLLKNLRDYQVGNIQGFLYEAIKNDLLDYIKIDKRNRRNFKPISDEVIQVADKTDLEQDLIFKDKIKQMKRVLTPDQSLLVKMLYHGYTQRQIALKLNISQPAVKKQIDKVRETLRPIFFDENETKRLQK